MLADTELMVSIHRILLLPKKSISGMNAPTNSTTGSIILLYIRVTNLTIQSATGKDEILKYLRIETNKVVFNYYTVE